ncbi:hypothetical protein [Mailhella sp.]
MYEITVTETRIYAPAETSEPATNDFPQLTTADTDWTDEERSAMRQHGYDGMDMLRAWLD